MRFPHSLGVPLVLVAMLAACSQTDGPGPKTLTTTVRVAGDDYADSGTFGYKFTVQNSDDPNKGFPVMPELVAASLRAPAICPYFRSADNGNTYTNSADCTNFAVGGARINYQPPLSVTVSQLPLLGTTLVNTPPLNGLLPNLPNLAGALSTLPLVGGIIASLPGVSGANSPLSVVKQLQTLGNSATFSTGDLFILVAGSNDISDLATQHIAASIDLGVGFGNLVSTLLGTSALPSSLASASNRQTLGNAYMSKLADVYYDAIKANLLDKGATKITILNLPNVNQTPRLAQAKATLAGAAEAGPVFLEWVNTFNTQLQTRIGNDRRFIQVSYLDLLNQLVTTSAALAVTNATTPVCPETGKGTLDNLPTYALKDCNSAALSAALPAGETSPDWWKSYGFSDSTHPTPYVHNLLARGVNLELIRAGIL